VGSSGLQVSRIGLGTMTWGDETDGDAAAEQLRVFVQSGGTLVETADGYGGGIAQDVLAGLMRRAVARDDLVLAGRSAGHVPGPYRPRGTLPGEGVAVLGGRAARPATSTFFRLRACSDDGWATAGCRCPASAWAR